MASPQLEDRYRRLVRRPWTSNERDLVIHGFAGRVLIAVEPLICAIFFVILTVLPFYLKVTTNVDVRDGITPMFSLAQVLAPIMAFGAIGFAVYTVGLMYKPLRALLSTHAPIYIVDGYLRYSCETNKHARRYTIVSVLNHESELIQEWRAPHVLDMLDGSYPALIEFSRYGGILKIDGREIDPPLFSLAPFGIGTFTNRSLK